MVAVLLQISTRNKEENMSIEKVVEMSIAAKEFSSVIEVTKISIDDLMTLSEIIPSINDDIQIIRDWVDQKEYTDTLDENPVIEVQPSVTTEDIKQPQHRIIIDNNTVIEIARYIASECNGMKTIDVFQKVISVFRDVKPDAIKRIVYKYTFKATTDPYFKIKNHRIAKNPTANSNVKESDGSVNKPVTNDTKTDKIDYSKMLESVCNKEALMELVDEAVKKGVQAKGIEDFCNDWRNLEQTNGDILKYIVKKDVDSDRCVQYTLVKLAMITKGIFQCVEDPEMVVMICDGIKKYGKKRTNRITNYVVKHYSMKTLPPKTFTELMFNVINKKAYPEISDKFFK